MKHIQINLTEALKPFYDENFKTLKKEIEEATRGWKDLSCSWINRLNIVKVTMLPKPTYRVNSISTKIPTQFFTEIEKYLKFHTERHTKTQDNPKDPE